MEKCFIVGQNSINSFGTYCPSITSETCSLRVRSLIANDICKIWLDIVLDKDGKVSVYYLVGHKALIPIDGSWISSFKRFRAVERFGEFLISLAVSEHKSKALPITLLSLTES